MIAEAEPGRARSSWWLRLLYAVLVVSALALVTLIAGDIVSGLESEHGELHHLFVFDLAWPVFVLSGLLVLSTGIAAVAYAAVRRGRAAMRYGAWALGYCILAVFAVALSEALA